jgi:hypothetical protein
MPTQDTERAPPRPTPNAAGRPRRLVFRTWVIVTAIMMAGAWILGRLVEDDRVGFVFTGVVFPILTALLLFLALGWLVRLVFRPGAGRRR